MIPVRLRLERSLGYEQAMYVVRIKMMESFTGLG
jgi:hypothetical protein